MSTTAIITARFNSKRLPGKALKPIGGKPLLQCVYDRVQVVTPDIIVATTKDSQPIIDYCVENNIPYFVSVNEDYAINEEDLIQRMALCGMINELDHVLRIWGDCPFLDPEIISNAVYYFSNNQNDYLYPYNFVKGTAFTLYDQEAFAKLYSQMSELERDHWNQVDELKGWIDHGNKVKFYNFERGPYPYILPGMNINTPEDLEIANKLVDKYGMDLSWRDLWVAPSAH